MRVGDDMECRATLVEAVAFVPDTLPSHFSVRVLCYSQTGARNCPDSCPVLQVVALWPQTTWGPRLAGNPLPTPPTVPPSAVLFVESAVEALAAFHLPAYGLAFACFPHEPMTGTTCRARLQPVAATLAAP